MAPETCKICGRPVTKCVCPVDNDADLEEEEDDEDEDDEIYDEYSTLVSKT